MWWRDKSDKNRQLSRGREERQRRKERVMEWKKLELAAEWREERKDAKKEKKIVSYVLGEEE